MQTNDWLNIENNNYNKSLNIIEISINELIIIDFINLLDSTMDNHGHNCIQQLIMLSKSWICLKILYII